MEATVFVGTSLDGFIAREDGSIDWLNSPEFAMGAEDYGFRAFMDTVDVLVMGSHTYDLVRTFDEWPYGSTPMVVLSSRDVVIPESLSALVESMNASPEEVIRRMDQRGAKHLYIDGGNTIQRFMAAGLITKLIITRLPVLIGSGISLFGPVPHDVFLRHVRTRDYSSGVVQSEYEVLRR